LWWVATGARLWHHFCHRGTSVQDNQSAVAPISKDHATFLSRLGRLGHTACWLLPPGVVLENLQSCDFRTALAGELRPQPNRCCGVALLQRQRASGASSTPTWPHPTQPFKPSGTLESAQVGGKSLLEEAGEGATCLSVLLLGARKLGQICTGPQAGIVVEGKQSISQKEVARRRSMRGSAC
jgi:hypothetical protein